MRALFIRAAELKPSVIFFDEIDSMLSSRGDNEHEASRRMKTEFLVQFDGVGSEMDKDVLIIAATNRPFDLDDAALRRFTKRIYVGMPDFKARAAVIDHVMKNESMKFTNSKWNKLIEYLDGYSSSDITALCKEAAMGPILEHHPEDVVHMKREDLRKIGY